MSDLEIRYAKVIDAGGDTVREIRVFVDPNGGWTLQMEAFSDLPVGDYTVDVGDHSLPLAIKP